MKTKIFFSTSESEKINFNWQMLSDGWSKAFQNFSVKCVDTLKSLQKEIARLNRFIAKHLYDKGPNGSWFWILSNVYKICHNFYPNNLWNFKEKRKKLRKKIWEISSFIFHSALLTFVKVITSKKPKKNPLYIFRHVTEMLS